jgi:hypothetical protein
MNEFEQFGLLILVFLTVILFFIVGGKHDE